MSATVLALKDVHKKVANSAIICGVDLQLQQGERLALIGPNGAGKTTLFNLISGRAAPSSGEILLHGRSIAGLTPFQVNRRGLARSFQVSNIFPQLSVQENLRVALLWPLAYRYAFWRRLSGLHDASRNTAQVLEQIGLSSCRDALAGSLSYAQQRALEIGITIAGGTDLLLLDEPTAGMSRDESAAAVALIRRISSGKTLLMVEHDMNVVFELADRIAVLVDGQIIACDTPAAIRRNAAVQAAYLGEGGWP
ncbi:ABC transporter ATP-binding protein [Paraherbaspirillum soli]|uniref:ABC transporter ATP-binding protein n=1 Tax=Paraherbaspirillum soli TaxID=631222 RepID=A0ABW0MET0_9BURK